MLFKYSFFFVEPYLTDHVNALPRAKISTLREFTLPLSVVTDVPTSLGYSRLSSGRRSSNVDSRRFRGAGEQCGWKHRTARTLHSLVNRTTVSIRSGVVRAATDERLAGLCQTLSRTQRREVVRRAMRDLGEICSSLGIVMSKDSFKSVSFSIFRWTSSTSRPLPWIGRSIFSVPIEWIKRTSSSFSRTWTAQSATLPGRKRSTSIGKPWRRSFPCKCIWRRSSSFDRLWPANKARIFTRRSADYFLRRATDVRFHFLWCSSIRFAENKWRFFVSSERTSSWDVSPSTHLISFFNELHREEKGVRRW